MLLDGMELLDDDLKKFDIVFVLALAFYFAYSYVKPFHVRICVF